MKRWALVAAGLSIGAIATVVTIGAALPERHVVSCRVHLRVPPDAVWALIADFERHPQWRTGLEAIERLPDREGRPTWRETGGTGPMTYVVDEQVPPRRLVTRIDDPELPFGGTWTLVLEPAEKGTALTLTEDGEITNPIFRFMARFVFGHHATMEQYLRDAGRQLGESVNVERVR